VLELLLPVGALAQADCPSARLISVTGTAEVRVAPDQAILRLAVESKAKELSFAKVQHDTTVKKLMLVIHDAGIEGKNVQTSELTMGPEYSQDDRKKTFVGYRVSQSFNVTLKELSKYETLLTKLLEGGLTSVEGVSFEVADPAKYRAEARVKAVQSAKEKAAALATEMGQTVGKPWSISEEGSDYAFYGSIGKLNANSYAYNAGQQADESIIAPGQITVSASVRVSFTME
jgi:uncharacterized protein